MKNLQLKTIQSLSLILLFGLFMTTSNKVVAQDIEDLVFYNSENGFVDDMVTALHMDDNGLLWIGTYANGAFTFDGETFNSISTEFFTPNLFVTDFSVDPEGSVWMSTMNSEEGSIFKFIEDQFVIQYDNDSGYETNEIREIHFEPEGTLWVAAKNTGLFKLDPGAEDFEQITGDVDYEISMENVIKIEQIEESILFCSGFWGWNMLEFNTAENSFKVWSESGFPTLPNSMEVLDLPGNYVFDIVGSSSDYWIASEYFSPDEESIVISNFNSYGLTNWEQYLTPTDLTMDNPRNLFTDSNGRLWATGLIDNKFPVLAYLKNGIWSQYTFEEESLSFNQYGNYDAEVVEDQNSGGLFLAGGMGLHFLPNAVLSGITPESSNELNSIIMYPNPCQDKIFIEPNTDNLLMGQNYMVSIFDFSGKELFNQTIKDVNRPLDVSSLNSGIYKLILTSPDYSIAKTIIKN